MSPSTLFGAPIRARKSKCSQKNVRFADILRPLGSLGAWLGQRVGFTQTWRRAHHRELAEKMSGDAPRNGASLAFAMYEEAWVSTAPQPFVGLLDPHHATAVTAPSRPVTA
jgi:hypothetical protein